MHLVRLTPPKTEALPSGWKTAVAPIRLASSSAKATSKPVSLPAASWKLNGG